MKRSGSLGMFCRLTVVSAVISTCSPPFSIPSGPNVILLMIDTVRADHMGIYGYERDTTPVLDRFGEENTTFHNAIAAAPWTPASVASILTGLYPAAHGMMPSDSREEALEGAERLPEDAHTLAEVYRANGYQTAGVTPNPWMKPGFGFGQGFDSYQYLADAHAHGINGAARELLEKFGESERPFFLYLHYLDAHRPYHPAKAERNRFVGQIEERAYREDMRHDMSRYDAEIRGMDAKLGELFDHLRQIGLYEDSVIVLVADHGEQFGEHGNVGHGFDLYAEETRIPLMIKNGGPSRVVHTAVSNVDIFATLVEISDLDHTPSTQGTSLLTPVPPGGRIGVLSEIERSNSLKSLVMPDGKKLILNLLTGESALFDPSQDRWEENPILDPELEAAMKAEIESVLRESAIYRQAFGNSRVPMDEATVRELEALGYM